MTFERNPDRLSRIAEHVVGQAASGELIDVVVGVNESTTVRAYDGDVESFTSATSAGIGVRVIVDGRVGFASAGSLDPEVVDELVDQARTNGLFSERDEHVGLAEPDGVEAVHLDQWNQSLVELSPQAKIDAALDLERRVRGGDPRITGVRSAAWGDGFGEVVFAASHGVVTYDCSTWCSIGVSALAQDGDERHSGGSGDAALCLDDLDTDRVVREAIDKSTKLFGATKPPSDRFTIVLDPTLTMTLFGIVANMLDGESVSKGRSPFADRVGEVIASPLVCLTDDPTQSNSIMATAFDGEGLACRANPMIVDGVLNGFLFDSTTARRLGARSTASAIRGVRGLPSVGPVVLMIRPGSGDLDSLLASVGNGILINSFSGLHSGVNSVSGDFSVGADGVIFRDGTLGQPVKEFTVASSIQKMLLNIQAVGGDGEWTSGGDYSASLAIGDVMVSGS